MLSSRKPGEQPSSARKPNANGKPQAGDKPDTTGSSLTEQQLDDVSGGLPAVQRSHS